MGEDVGKPVREKLVTHVGANVGVMGATRVRFVVNKYTDGAVVGLLLGATDGFGLEYGRVAEYVNDVDDDVDDVVPVKFTVFVVAVVVAVVPVVIDGINVGFPDGTFVTGDLVGCVVGLLNGDLVGFNVGLLDGDLVTGDLVGDDVGHHVSSPVHCTGFT